MDEMTFFIAEGMKGLNNAAVELITKGEYDEAEKVFRTVEETARLFSYKEGIGMVRVSLANLSVMRGNILEALTHIDVATEYQPPGDGREEACTLRKKISILALEKGIEKEKQGDLKGALELFERILPNLNEKRAVLVSNEIENIKRYLKAVQQGGPKR